ncbi:hypothetical protein [Kitasatospora sp. NPDC056531]|uniref:hypothetical protein n=1 Tax=Kitasatospora sp. NPDC056531 TaxID=3345856 RepID=UPI0036BFA385
MLSAVGEEEFADRAREAATLLPAGTKPAVLRQKRQVPSTSASAAADTGGGSGSSCPRITVRRARYSRRRATASSGSSASSAGPACCLGPGCGSR